MPLLALTWISDLDSRLSAERVRVSHACFQYILGTKPGNPSTPGT